MSEATQTQAYGSLTRKGARIVAGQHAKLRKQRFSEGNTAAWIVIAVERLRNYAKNHPGVFSMEQARAAFGADLPPIRELRTWGRVTQLAAAEGVIARVPKVYIPAASSNNTPKPAWRRGPNA